MEHERAWYLDWGKAALLAPIVMATLCLGIFLALKVLGSRNPSDSAFVFIFMVPGGIVFLPFILKEFHSAWSGYFVLSIVLNWLIYTSLVRWLIVRRRRRRTAA
jgi:hypothetical protein